MEILIACVEIALAVYLFAGLLLLYPMHRTILPKLDSSADGASWSFRLVVSPGLVALWPIILLKARALRGGRNPHGSPDWPVSSRRIRVAQSLLVKLLAIALPLLVAAALYTRPAPPVPTELPKDFATDVR